jgi:hypothetical protein
MKVKKNYFFIIKNILFVLLIIIIILYLLSLLYLIYNNSIQNLMNEIKNKKILIIGNGPSALNKERINLDNKYDIIIRINKKKNENKYKKCIGSKTNIYVNNPCRYFQKLDKNNINKKKIIIYKGILDILIFPFINFSNIILGFYNSKYYKNTYTYYLNFFDSKLITNNNFKIPTTGLSLLYLLNKYNINYDLMGFDSLMKKNIDYKHYDNSKAVLKEIHNFNNEYDYFQKNKKNVNII